MSDNPPNEFQLRLTSPKNADEVGMESPNGGILAFKIFPKAWDSNHGDNEVHDIFQSPQQDDDDDDDDDDDIIEDHVISGVGRLQHSINLPPMSPTMLSPPVGKYVASQVSVEFVCRFNN